MPTKQKTNPLLDDFRNFLYVVWKHLRLPDPSDIQYDIAYQLQHGERRMVIEGYRGVGKSWITSAFVCWLLLRNPQLNILVVSASKSRSDKFSTFVQRLISEMPELSHLRPKPNQRNSMVSFDVGPAMASHAPSVSSKGITGQITGDRADIIIADDIEVPSNSLTQTMRDQLSERIKEFEAILKPNGRIIYLGTPQTEDSIYTRLPERGYTRRLWPARYPDAARIRRDGDIIAAYIIEQLRVRGDGAVGTSTDPKRFSDIDLLEREASYGKSGFALQFQLDTQLSDADRYPLKFNDLIIMDLDHSLVPEKVVYSSGPDYIINDVPNVGLSRDYFHRPMHVSPTMLPVTFTVMTIDPAGKGADATAWCIGTCVNSQVFVFEWKSMQGGYSTEVLEAIAEDARKYGVKAIQVESNFGDGMFASLLQPYIMKVCTASVDTKRVSTQKELRIITSLEPAMNQHKLIINKNLIQQDYDSCQHYAEDQRKNYMGFYQLSRITKERGSLAHDDMIDCLADLVGYFVDLGAMKQDVDKQMEAENRRREAQLLKDFTGRCFAQRMQYGENYKRRPPGGNKGMTW